MKCTVPEACKQRTAISPSALRETIALLARVMPGA
jgi:hypothetical protein